MKYPKLILLALFIAFVLPSGAQDKKHSIGIQANPYLDSYSKVFGGAFSKNVYALRYTNRLTDNLSLGPELSGFRIRRTDEADIDLWHLNLGMFVRYSFLPEKRINFFAEVSPYYTLSHIKSVNAFTLEGNGIDRRDKSFSGYISPGISLFSKNRRFSLDLMYKFSDKTFVNSNKSVFSYRLNFNF